MSYPVDEKTLEGTESLEEGKSFVESTNPWLNLPPWRRRAILILLCASEVFDVFTSSGAVTSLTQIESELNFPPGTVSWVLTAYTLTFASFMLLGGRISDIYDPKPAFCLGFLSIGLFSIPIAFGTHPAILVVFRALQGIGGAMNVPACVAMISAAFPDPVDKGKALAWYGFSASWGGVMGFVLGGIFTEYLSWRWIFYLLAICVIPCSVASWYLLPFYPTEVHFYWRDLDFPGVILLTISLCLFVFSISLGNTMGWVSPQIIATLISSGLFFIIFCLTERIVANPAFPPRIWLTKHFIPLLLYISVLGWSTGAQVQLMGVFKSLWHDTYLISAIHCIPAGICSGGAAYLAGKFVHRVPRRIPLVLGMAGVAGSWALFAFADTRDKYWTFVFPGIIIGYSGAGLSLVAAITSVMNGAGPHDAGVVGAMMHTVLTMGVTVGLTVLTAITLGVNKLEDPSSAVPAASHMGYKASFLALLGIDGVIILVILIFVRD